MATLLLGIGLVFVLEGLAWVLAPSLVERLLETMRALPVPARRQIGALGVVMGLIFLWGAQALGL